MNKKKLLYVGLALLVLVGAYFAWKKFGSSGTTAPSSVLTYTDSDITKEISIIKADKAWFDTVKTKAAAAGKSVDDQLRLDAIYMLEAVQGRKRA